jgi:hypothetical protein
MSEEPQAEAADPAEEARPVAPAAPLPQPRRPLRWIIAAIALAVVVTASIAGLRFWSSWNEPGRIEPSGGLYFLKRVELPVPSFRQADPRWRDEPLGPTDGTLGGEGCAVSSTAMILASYGIDTDPQRLNSFLIEHEGYTPQGWIYWEKAAELAPEKVKHVYEDAASYRLIDSNVCCGNPVIVKLRLPSGTTHFVVIAGKDGYDYLTRDPGAGARKGLYPLRELGSKIEGLRFYQKLK